MYMKANGQEWNVTGKTVHVVDDELYINGKIVQKRGGFVFFGASDKKKKSKKKK